MMISLNLRAWPTMPAQDFGDELRNAVIEAGAPSVIVAAIDGLLDPGDLLDDPEVTRALEAEYADGARSMHSGILAALEEALAADDRLPRSEIGLAEIQREQVLEIVRRLKP